MLTVRRSAPQLPDEHHATVGLRQWVYNRPFHEGAGAADETPILLVGMPRSGTTLMEQIVTCHPMVAGGDEPIYWGEQEAFVMRLRPDGVPPAEIERPATGYQAVLRAISTGAPRVSDKMPFNSTGTQP
jgi:hypothetical protein